MVRESEAKTTSLILTAIVMLLAIVIPSGRELGLTDGGTVAGRLLYPFFHANLLHAGVNCWCLLSFVFLYDLSLWALLAGYLIAISVPAALVPGFTIGMSGICFALMGLCSWMVMRKVYYNCMAAAFIGLGFLFPNVAAMLHLYCYVVGSLTGLLFYRR